ncbi:MAG: exonuclease SbcCD subunit D, partial [Nocardioides sp.]
WVQATLTDAVRPREPMERLRARFPHVVALEFAPAGGEAARSPTSRPRGRTDHEITLEFVDTMRGAPASAAEAALLRDAADACCDDTDLDPAGRVPG